MIILSKIKLFVYIVFSIVALFNIVPHLNLYSVTVWVITPFVIAPYTALVIYLCEEKYDGSV